MKGIVNSLLKKSKKEGLASLDSSVLPLCKQKFYRDFVSKYFLKLKETCDGNIYSNI